MAQSRLKEFPHGFAAAQLLSLHDTHVLYKYHAAANCMISCKTGQTNACSPDVGDPYLRVCTACHQHQPVTLTEAACGGAAAAAAELSMFAAAGGGCACAASVV
jgi:hypothetical protein